MSVYDFYTLLIFKLRLRVIREYTILNIKSISNFVDLSSEERLI